MKTLTKNCFFTNCAQTDDNDVWWEQMADTPPAHLIDWKGNDWTPQSKGKAAHPNARFTAPARQCPVIAPEWEDPNGVPVSAILFGGRRATVVPLVHEARDWEHGTFIGSIMGSEQTAAAAGKVGDLRRDPMAMLPFCGYNMGDYWNHWLRIGRQEGAQLPRVFYVNWFRKDADGNFLWPGFGENSRVLKWIFERCEGSVKGKDTPIGNVPDGDLDVSGLPLSPQALADLMKIDVDGWLEEIPMIREYYKTFGEHLPKELLVQLDRLQKRLEAR